MKLWDYLEDLGELSLNFEDWGSRTRGQKVLGLVLFGIWICVAVVVLWFFGIRSIGDVFDSVGACFFAVIILVLFFVGSALLPLMLMDIAGKILRVRKKPSFAEQIVVYTGAITLYAALLTGLCYTIKAIYWLGKRWF